MEVDSGWDFGAGEDGRRTELGRRAELGWRAGDCLLSLGMAISVAARLGAGRACGR